MQENSVDCLRFLFQGPPGDMGGEGASGRNGSMVSPCLEYLTIMFCTDLGNNQSDKVNAFHQKRYTGLAKP